ncbi:MarR family transcriptional regulator [Sphingomonadaceae bacterium OTU29MARTA1]|uniref:MarR family winged helix-turn-helix transcriptional regulator n=1 Tax=Sphingomonas sp. Leaf37 TaxID=2876552 RepID=UPI001E29A34F|nr:MarR family transcriptional regulator [Sphingomonas sp. Leaf37]USU06637.1 MarR family transcriptional regulator [Sphingomonadaceae bacterium OTU29LAMAA1]USU10006.1 MarR family transcriptional regulator [Sphingomonadaceae bacterium OTU29MARTA1]USU13456.1 MarR family transcriptional regulator [Sphingomonadaceae bacterium OTU29THOMA1]
MTDIAHSPALLACARQARQLRATMSAFLPRDLLVDPAWDMMIDLFIARCTAERLCVKDLILLSGESPASAMRRIDRLQHAGLIERQADPADHRRVHVGLTEAGQTAMAAMLAHLFDHRGEDGEAPATPKSFQPGATRG